MVDCPVEVSDFIEAIAAKLPDFGQIGKERVRITGYELLLSGVKEFKSEPVDTYAVYDLPIPRMVACDHVSAMHRIYNRKGKQGLIDFCRNKVNGTELARVLEILDVHVFKQERPEFKKVMTEINAQKKLDSDLKL